MDIKIRKRILQDLDLLNEQIDALRRLPKGFPSPEIHRNHDAIMALMGETLYGLQEQLQRPPRKMA